MRMGFATGRTWMAVAWILAIMIGSPGPARATEAVSLSPNRSDLTLTKEIVRARAMGIDYLEKHQNPDGSWSNPGFPALTGLVLYAVARSPQYAGMSPRPAFIQKGLDYITASIQPDGGIYREGLPNYNTAICIMALAAANDPAYHEHIVRARHYLASLQKDDGVKGKTDQAFDGGIGYGSKDHSDMSNTYLALEALKSTEFLESDQHLALYRDLQGLGKTKLNWAAALKFIQRCQNLPGYNDQGWASDDPKNRGGFVYFPGNSKAGKETLPNGHEALRSYGSMTYAGLLSLIYADLKKDDPRVSAAYEWIRHNYTLGGESGARPAGAVLLLSHPGQSPDRLWPRRVGNRSGPAGELAPGTGGQAGRKTKGGRILGQ